MIMPDFEQQIRQKLLDEDYYYYRLKDLNFSIEDLLKVSKSIKDPYMATMVDSFYDKMSLEYTAGKPIEDILVLMAMVIKYTGKTQDFVERKTKDTWGKYEVMIELFSKLTETEVLPNLLGLCMLFNRMDWIGCKL